MKTFYTQYNIGNAKYVVSFHDGVKLHPDNSRFFDIKLFSNKKEFNSFIDELKNNGYTER